MVILPAIDIQNRQCVRLVKGDFSTAHQVAADPLATAKSFKAAGARWIHMVDLDGAREGRRINADIFLQVAKESGLKVELGGGIRDMETLDYYFKGGISRCILGSAALKDPAFVKKAVAKYGHRVAVGIDAKDGMVATEGWLDVSEVSYLDLAKQMEKIGVQVIIFTDISRDGTLTGPNMEQLKALKEAVGCHIIASGGIRELSNIQDCKDAELYGAICGKSLYSGTLDLAEAVQTAETDIDRMELEQYLDKQPLCPAIVQEAGTGEVLMLGYMNAVSLQKTLETGETWYWSRSRSCYWHKGATSGHTQKVLSIRSDCDKDTLLIKVKQIGPACHTGAHSCFFNTIKRED